jgi:hypothetical protein
MVEDAENPEREDIPDVRNDAASEGGRGDDPTGPTTDSGPQRDAPRAEPIDIESEGDARTGPEETEELTRDTRTETTSEVETASETRGVEPTEADDA